MSPSYSVESQKSAAFFDLDNTIVEGSSIYYFAKGLVKQGELTRRSIAKMAYQHFQYKRTKTETENAIETTTKKLLEFSRDKTCAHLQNLCHAIVDEFLPKKINKELLSHIERHKSEGRDTWIMTASPIEIAEVIAKKLGMTGAFGTRGEIVGGAYSGNVLEKPLHGFSKAEKVFELAAEHKYNLDDSFAYSDSMNDLPLLISVGNPNIVNPNKELKAVAQKNNWPILRSA